MSDGHFDAPAYCAICDRPIATGPICATCEEAERIEECEHLSMVTYTVRDWRETGIAPGTVCEDCGKEFEQEEIEAMDTRDFEEMVLDKADRQRERYQ